MSDHRVQIIAYYDRATGVCACGFSSGEQFGDRRTAKAKHSLLVHLESAHSDPNEFHIKDGSPLDCPLCRKDLELSNGDKGLLLEDQPSVVQCEDGHEFDCYYKHGTLFLFNNEYEDGPFATR